jgi:hypothetical protein
MKPGPKPLLGTTMTHAERQARYRAAHAESAPPKVRYRKSVDRRSRAQRWHDAATELQELQAAYQAWLDALPENLTDSAVADALRETCDLDLSPLMSVQPPRGFGRD